MGRLARRSPAHLLGRIRCRNRPGLGLPRDFSGLSTGLRPEEREKRAVAGQAEWFDEDDLYPDSRSTLASLRADGLWVGIAGNQTKRACDLLRSLGLPSDMIANVR